MLTPTAYLNGGFLPAGHLFLFSNDIGFTEGIVITDRLRTFRQQIFRLDDHLRRFRQSCELAFVPQPRPDVELAEAARSLVEMNAEVYGAATEFAVSIFATPGAAEPTLGIQVMTLNFERYRHLFERGAILEPMPRAIPPELIDPRIKHRGRLPYWIARHELHARPGADPNVEPLLTAGDLVRETPVANFLAEIDGELISPPRSRILNGISLDVVEELCRENGIPFCEREMAIEEVMSRAGECILTNTSFCLAPVSQIAGRIKSRDGPLFGRLLHAWSDMVGVDIRGQFLA